MSNSRIGTFFRVTLLMLGGFAANGNLRGQTLPPADKPAEAFDRLSPAELEELLGPIALYPDVLLAQILPASTYPLEVVQAARWVNNNRDPSKLDEQNWDPSVKAIARYPSVLKRMDENLEWTNALGTAFLNQPEDVMDGIQQLRVKASGSGALRATTEQAVEVDQNVIRIAPRDPAVVYVPQYDPVVVYQPVPTSSGAVATSFISFGAGVGVGPWLDMSFDWRAHSVYYYRTPYAGAFYGAHGAVAFRQHRVPGIGRYGGFPAGGHGGIIAGQRGGVVFGDDGHALTWRRRPGVPGPYLSPNYRGSLQGRFESTHRNIPRAVMGIDPRGRTRGSEAVRGAFGGYRPGSEVRRDSARGQESVNAARGRPSAPVTRPAPGIQRSRPTPPPPGRSSGAFGGIRGGGKSRAFSERGQTSRGGGSRGKRR